MKDRYLVYLTGGLGNQMFQLAAAFSMNKESQSIICIDSELGKPRKNGLHPDLFDFLLPRNIEIFDKKPSFLTSKTAGFLLRMGISPKKWETIPLISQFLGLGAKLILFTHYRKFVSLTVGRDVGFSKIIWNQNTIQIGYFQSFKYLEDMDVYEKMEKIEPRETNVKLESLIEKASSENPIFVHFRFQDYLYHDHFGIPSPRYYEKAISSLGGEHRKIWVFSDDQVEAKKVFPKVFERNAYFVEDESLSPAQVLHLLRFGSDYVIANSTFSWWGAQLRMKKSSRVIAPKPWFSALPEPRDLIPLSWERENAQL